VGKAKNESAGTILFGVTSATRMNQRLTEQVLSIVSQVRSRASAAFDVMVIGEPGAAALCEELAAAGARVAIHASAAETPAYLHPAVVVDARSAPVDVRIADLLVALTRLAPAGIYVSTAPFIAGADGGSRHLTLFDAVQAIAELVAGGVEPARGLAVLPRPDGRALELSASPLEVRAFFQRAVAAVEARNGLVLVRRSDTAADTDDPIQVADLPAGPAFEARRLSRAISAEGLADLALERFDQRVVAEIDVLKRRLAQRDRDLGELRAAFKRAADPGGASAVSRSPRGFGASWSAVSDPSSDFRDQMRRLERSARKVWKAPLALLGKSKENR
jgi:hypothetical protein